MATTINTSIPTYTPVPPPEPVKQAPPVKKPAPTSEAIRAYNPPGGSTDTLGTRVNTFA